MANARILVVEDEVVVARDIQNTLKRLGYSVDTVVSSGVEAIRNVAETRPDLVLMDIVLEGDMDGIEAAERIGGVFDTPVVYLTAYADDKTLQRAKVTEPYGYILKPFQERELHTTIEMALYKHKMERKLKENKEWLATTLKSIGDAVIATDARGHVTFMNPVAEVLTGWKQEDAAEKPLQEVFNVEKPLKEVFNIIDKEIGKEPVDPVTRILQEGVVVGLGNDTVLIAKDGTKRPIDHSGAPITDDKGNVAGLVFVFRDISERRRVDETVKRLGRLNELILNSAGEGIFGLDLRGKTIFVNPAAAGMFGRDLEELVDQSLHDLVHHSRPDGTEYSREECPICGVFRDGRARHGDELFWRKNGTNFPVEYISAPILEQGEIVGAVVTFKDITKRRQAQEALLQSERKFKSLTEATTDWVWEVDARGVYTYASPKVKYLLGYEASEVLGKTPFDLMPKEEAKKIAAFFSEKIMNKEPFYGLENVNRHKDGRLVVLETNAIPVYDEKGQLKGYRGIDRDITERKRLEDSLLRSKKRLRSLSSSLLVAQEQERKKISQELHDDLGQILTAILLDIAQAKKLEIPVASGIYSFLDRIQAGTEESLQRVRSLSAVLRPGVLDHLGLEAAVASFLEDFRERTGLTVVEEIRLVNKDIAEPVAIVIYRILQEATTNIIKHGAATQIIIQLHSDQHTVALTVTDDGKGFDPQSLPTDQGIGIMGMRERTGRLGGAFRLGSAPGQGTIVYAEVPLSAGKSIT